MARRIGRRASNAEFITAMNQYNFELNRANQNGGLVEGGWDEKKYAGLKEYVSRNPDKLKMPRAVFDRKLAEALGGLKKK